MHHLPKPTLTIPLGKYPNGKPYGLTLVGKGCADHKLLQFSQLFERDFPARLIPRATRWKRFMAYVPNFLAQKVFWN
ncbi:hypothetical protein BDV29DRAFT_172979 [Aspergillus leporis]|uniref:Amidase domain-containing protein n=1 Tax=Aspergillus leporis TaxID=41062 RepID=A0A5N5X5R7_9EURO|nr:hypothetical protein BDV29DRAFT_172979 [Aspergillus leporis]